jgi:hypothetical protein
MAVAEESLLAVRRAAEMHAVYRMFDADGKPLYIGVTGRSSRFGEHSTKSWFPLVANIALQWHGTREEADRAEREAIFREQPIYNITGKAVPPCHARPRQKHRRQPGSPRGARSLTVARVASELITPMLDRGTTTSEVAATLSVTKWTARVYLEDLRAKGAVKVVGDRRTALWKTVGGDSQ